MPNREITDENYAYLEYRFPPGADPRGVPEEGGDPPEPEPEVPQANFTAPTSSAPAAGPGTTIGMSLSFPSGNGTTVPFEVTSSSGAVRGTDWVLRTGPLATDPISNTETIAIEAGLNAGFLYFFALVDDHEVQFELVETNANGDAISGAELGTELTHTVTIPAENATPTVEWELTQSEMDEGDTITIHAQLSNTTTETVLVRWNTSGTATPGADYFTNPPTGGVIAFPPNTLQADFEIAAQIDADFTEGVETASFELRLPLNATLGPQIVHTVTINDSPPPGGHLIEFTGVDAVLVEAAAPGQVVALPITVTNGLPAPTGGINVPFHFSLPTGSPPAQPGVHYTVENAPGNEAHIPAGELSTSVNLRTLVTPGLEENATAIIRLDPPSVGTLGPEDNRNISYFDAGAASSGTIDGNLNDYQAVQIAEERIVDDTYTTDLEIEPGIVRIVHPDYSQTGTLAHLWQKVQAANGADYFTPQYFVQASHNELELAANVMAAIWEHEQLTKPGAPGVRPLIGQTALDLGGKIIKATVTNIVSAETAAVSPNLSAGDSIVMPTRYNASTSSPGGAGFKTVGVQYLIKNSSSGSGPKMLWDDTWCLNSYSGGGPALNGVMRDILFDSPDVTGLLSASDFWWECCPMELNTDTGVGQTSDLTDNIIWARMWAPMNVPTGIQLNNTARAYFFAGKSSEIKEQGVWRWYDYRVTNEARNIGYGGLTQPLWTWGYSGTVPASGARAAKWGWHIKHPMSIRCHRRVNVAMPAVWGDGVAQEHYRYIHGLVGPRHYATILIGIQVLNDLNDGPHAAARTADQFGNRQDDLNRLAPSGGEMIFLDPTYVDVGGQINDGGTVISVWMHDGRVYIRNYQNVAASWNGRGFGAILCTHDYGGAVQGQTQGTYPLQPLGAGWPGAGGPFTPPLVNTQELVIDGLYHSVPNAQGKRAMVLVGVETVRVIAFRIHASDGQEPVRFNMSFDEDSGPKPGLMHTRQFLLGDLKVPDANGQRTAVAHPANDFADYDGWSGVGSTRRIRDGYHTNVVQRDNLLADFRADGGTGEAALNNFEALVAEQWARAQDDETYDMTAQAEWMAHVGRALPTPPVGDLTADSGPSGATLYRDASITTAIEVDMTGESYHPRRLSYTETPGTATSGVQYQINDASPALVPQDFERANLPNAWGTQHRFPRGTIGGGYYKSKWFWFELEGLDTQNPGTLAPGSTEFAFNLAAFEWQYPYDGSAGWVGLALGTATRTVRMVPWVDLCEVFLTGFSVFVPVSVFQSGYTVQVGRRQFAAGGDGYQLPSECILGSEVQTGSVSFQLRDVNQSSRPEVAWPRGAGQSADSFRAFRFQSVSNAAAGDVIVLRVELPSATLTSLQPVQLANQDGSHTPFMVITLT